MKTTTFASKFDLARLSMICLMAVLISLSVSSCEFYSRGELDDDIDVHVDTNDGHDRDHDHRR